MPDPFSPLPSETPHKDGRQEPPSAAQPDTLRESIAAGTENSITANPANSYASETPLEGPPAQVNWAEVVQSSLPRPRIWSALIAGIFSIPLAIAVSTGVVMAFMIADLGIQQLSRPLVIKAWMDDFIVTRLGLFALILPGQITVVAVAIMGALLSPQPFHERLGLLRGRLHPATWPLLAIGTPMIGFITAILLNSVIEERGEHLKQIERMFSSHAGPFMVVVGLLVAVVPGICEELLFRGYVQTRLLARFPPWAAIGIASILFSAAHMDPVHCLTVFPLGVWLGILAWRTGSIWPSVFGHITNNGLSIGMMQFAGARDEVALAAGMLCILSICGTCLMISFALLVLAGNRQPTAFFSSVE